MDKANKKDIEKNDYSLYRNDDQLIRQGRKYSDNLTSTYIDPLKELDKEIRESFFYRYGIKQTDFFKLSQTDTNIDEKTQVDQIEIHHHEFIHNTLIENMDDYGQPLVLCESKNYVVIGSAFSIFYAFDKRLSNKENYFIGGTDKLKELGKVTSIAINHDEVVMAIGFENGDIGIYEMKNNYPRMTSIKKVFKSPVKIIQFVSEHHPSLKEFCMVVFDETGQNQKIQVDVTIVFDKRFTSVNKDKLVYQLMQSKDEEDIKQRSGSKEDSVNIRERSISDKFKETFKAGDNSLGKIRETINSLNVHEISYLNAISSSKYFNGNYKILAVATDNSIYIGFLLYKSIQFTFQFSKNISSDDNGDDKGESKNNNDNQKNNKQKVQKPSISWGQGYFQGNNSGFPILCIGWEDHIFLIKAQLLDDEQIHFYQTAFAKFAHPIEKCHFISKSIIFVIFTNKECALIHTSNFTLGPEDSQLSKLNSCMYIDHKNEFEKMALIAPQSKHNLFYYFNDCSVMFLLPQSLMFSFELKTWQDYFNNRDQADWIKLMQHGLMVQTNTIKYLGGVEDEKSKRQQEMKSFFQTLGLTYISLSFVAEDVTEEKVKEVLVLGTEFLLSTDNSDYLFDVASIAIKNFGYETCFLETLQTFIEHSKLRHVPNDYLKTIMTFYSGKGRYDVLQKLILNLDLTNLDISPLLVMCIDYGLFNALIYICTKSGDFLTPLVKLFGRYQKGFEKKEQQKKFGIKVLWYIQQSFSGIMIDGSKIDEQMYPLMLRNLILFVFQMENLQSLLQIDRKITLDIIFILFKQRVQNIIMKNCEIFRIDAEQSWVEKYDIFDKEKLTPQFIPYQRMLTIILKNKENELKEIQENKNTTQDEKNEEIQYLEHLHNVFFSRVLELQNYPFNLNQQIDIVVFLIENPKIFNYFEQKMIGLDAEVQHESDKPKKDIMLEQGLFLSDQQKYHKKWLVRNAFLINILRPLVPLIHDPLVISNIIQLSEINEFTEACCFLYNYQKNYKRCFDLYFESRNPLIQNRIFEWIEQVFESQEPNQSNVVDLQNLTITKIKDLVKLDQIKTKKLIKKYFYNKQKDIILQLDFYPDDQLAILEEFVNDSDKVSDDIKLTYIKLLCQRKPHLVIQNLKEREYPVDQALAYCQEYKILDAQVYLNCRNGKFSDALDIQIQIINQAWKDCVKKYTFDSNQNNSIGESNNSLKDIQFNLKKGMEICVQAQKEDDSNDAMWFTMFDRIVVQEIGISTLTSNSVCSQLQNISTSIVSELLEAMSVNINLNDVLDRIHRDYGTIPLKAFIQTNQHFKQKFEFLTSAHTTAKQILQDHMFNIQENYLQIKNKGLCGSQLPDYRVCQLCENQIQPNQKEFQNTDTIVFYCGHTYHKKCVDEFIQPIACPICVENPTIYLTNYLSASKNFTKNMSNRLQMQQQKDEQYDSQWDQQGAQNGWITATYSAPLPVKSKVVRQTKNKIMEKLTRFDRSKKQKKAETQIYFTEQQ